MIRILRAGDGEWPPRLDELGPHKPPAQLFAQGRPLDPAAPAVAVVGTRRPTVAGIEIAETLGRALAEAGFVVVSGLAVGVDAAAHRAALGAGGHTVAVLGCGLDVTYPRANRKLKAEIAARGTLLSEYPQGTPPKALHFPLRNRVIAGLSHGVVVVEGAVSSGALVTARLALDANRSVYAVPGSLRNAMAAGPNHLIRTSQAALITCAEHVFEDLAPGLAWGPHARSGQRCTPVPSDDVERRALAALDDAPVAPDRLCALLGVKPGRLAIALSKLEVKGLVARGPAGYSIARAGARLRCDAGGEI